MAATIRDHATTTAAGTGSINASVPSSVVENDLLIAAVSVFAATPDIDTPSGWTLIRSDQNTYDYLNVYYRYATGSEPSTYAFTNNSDSNCLWNATMISIAGVDQSTAVVGNSGQIIDAATDFTAPSITPGSSDFLLLHFSCNNSAGVSWTPPSGMTELADFGVSGGGYQQYQQCSYESVTSGSSTGTRTATASVSGYGAASMICVDTATPQQVTINPAEIELQGQQLSISAPPPDQQVDITPAEIELQGQPFSISAPAPNQQVDITPVEIELQGQQFTIDSDSNVDITPAEIELQGQQFTITAPSNQQVEISPAEIELQGQPFSIDAPVEIPINPTEIELQGQPFDISSDSRVNISPAEIELQGKQFGITADGLVEINSAEIELQGQQFSVSAGVADQQVDINLAGLRLQGKQFTVTVEDADKTVEINPAEIELQGQPFNITAAGEGQVVTINPAQIELNPRRLIVETVGGPTLIGHAAPLSLSVTSLNQTDDGNGTHEHEIISSSNPGTNESLLATDVTGKLLLEKFGANRIVTDLIPDQTDTFDLGSSTSLWRKGWLSELDTILFAENTVTLLGGWFYVTKDAGVLAEDVDAVQTTIDFGKTMTTGDFVVLRQSLQVEYLEIGTLVADTTYNVTRNVDGSGANTWPSGAPFAVFGQAGDGRIEFNAYDTPRIQLLQQGAAYNDQTEMIRIGDLDQNWGYTAETWGVAIGEYDASKGHLVYDPTNGLRLRIGSDTYIQLSNAGDASIEGVLELGSNGGIWQGSGSFATPTTGLKLWNDSGTGRLAGYNGGTIQIELATDGKLKAGNNTVIFDETGINIEADSTIGAQHQIKWNNGIGGQSLIISADNLGNSHIESSDQLELEINGSPKILLTGNDLWLYGNTEIQNGHLNVGKGLHVGNTATTPTADDVGYDGNLKSRKGGTNYDVYGYHGLTSAYIVTGDTSLTGSNGTGAAITLSNVPSSAKAVQIRVVVWGDAVGQYVYFGAGNASVAERWQVGQEVNTTARGLNVNGVITFKTAQTIYRIHQALSGTVHYLLYVLGYYI